MPVKKITAVLLVDQVEPCIKFWTEGLGFQKTVDVPDGEKIAFVTLQSGTTEVMYQTYASVAKDNPGSADLTRRGPTFLYVEVDDLDETIRAVKSAEVVMPVRTTFYGAKEIGVKEPGGHVITFAQFGAAAAN
jgi:uncharacterized glyoxalase superfamily protein PhnB